VETVELEVLVERQYMMYCVTNTRSYLLWFVALKPSVMQPYK